MTLVVEEYECVSLPLLVFWVSYAQPPFFSSKDPRGKSFSIFSCNRNFQRIFSELKGELYLELHVGELHENRQSKQHKTKIKVVTFSDDRTRLVGYNTNRT